MLHDMVNVFTFTISAILVLFGAVGVLIGIFTGTVHNIVIGLFMVAIGYVNCRSDISTE